MRYIIMVLVALAIVTGILKYREQLERLYRRYDRRETALMKRDLEDGNGNVAPSPATGGRLLKSGRPELQATVQASISVPESCKPFVTEIHGLDLLELDKNRYPISYQQLPGMSESCRFEDPRLKAAIKKVQEVCRPVASMSETISERCATQVFMLRAALTRQMMSARPLSSITDMRILMDLMFAEFAVVDGQTLPHLRTARLVAERMLDLDPQLYAAAKVSAFAEIMTQFDLQMKQGTRREADWESSRELLARAERLSPNEPGLESAKALVETRGFQPDLCVQYGQKKIDQDQKNAEAWFIKAYGEWKLNRRAESRTSLRRAIELAPGQSDYAKTWVEIEKPNAGPDAFQGALTFGIQPQDFER